MKKPSTVIAITVFAIIAVMDIIHEVIANDAVHYFTEQPRRILFIATIAIVGGLVWLMVDRLSPRLQRNLKLLILGSTAGCSTVFAAYLISVLADLSWQLGLSDSRHAIIALPLCLGVATALLWFEFYQAFRRQSV